MKLKKSAMAPALCMFFGLVISGLRLQKFRKKRKTTAHPLLDIKHGRLVSLVRLIRALPNLTTYQRGLVGDILNDFIPSAEDLSAVKKYRLACAVVSWCDINNEYSQRGSQWE